MLEDYAMADRELLGLAASAKVGGHPIHSMLVPFPIALLVATFVQAVWPGGFLLSLLTFLLLLYTGWKGGELVYHHRIGMHPEAEDGTTPPPAVKHRTRHI